MGKGVCVIVRISNRLDEAPDVQSVLTKYGCSIKSRLGLHEVNDNSCASDGLIILICIGKDNEIKELVSDLNKINGVKAVSSDLPTF